MLLFTPKLSETVLIYSRSLVCLHNLIENRFSKYSCQLFKINADVILNEVRTYLLIFRVWIFLAFCYQNCSDLLQEKKNTVDQESQFTNSQTFGQHNISIVRIISLTRYENATTCQKVETPPPKYLELFFSTKTSTPTLDPISEV